MVDVSHRLFHKSLKGGQCYTETKRHLVKLIETKSYFEFIFICNFNFASTQIRSLILRNTWSLLADVENPRCGE